MYSFIKYFRKLTVPVLAAAMVLISKNNIQAEVIKMNIFYDGANHNYVAEEVNIVVNNEQINNMDVPPLIINERTMVPARAIFEKLGCSIAWNEDTKEVHIMRDTDIITLKIDSNNGVKNGETFYMDTPAKIVNDRTLIPVRAVSEAIDCNVDWNAEKRIVSISSKKEETPSNGNVVSSGSNGTDNGTILGPNDEIDKPNEVIDNNNQNNQNSNQNTNTPNNNQNTNSNVVTNNNKTIDILGITVPESFLSEQKFYIRASDVIDNYNSFVLENSRIVIDIQNADMKITNTNITNTNSTLVTAVRSAQNQTEPTKIARVVFDVGSVGDYEVKLSEDKKSIEVSFGVAKVFNIAATSNGGSDYINIYGDTALSVKTNILANTVLIDISNAVSVLDNEYPVEGIFNFVEGITTQQYDSKTVQIILNVNRNVETEVINNNGFTTVKINKPAFENIIYNSSQHTLTLLNTNSLNDRNIDTTDNYMGKTYRVTMSGNYSDLFGAGTINCNDDYINNIKIGIDQNGNTYFEASENRILATKIIDNDDNIVINFVSPKEVYDKIVVIDAGHGSQDNGSYGNGIYEKDANLEIVKRLYNLLENDPNIKVYATRLDDSYPTNINRAEMANQTADLFVSVHQNSIERTGPKGTEVLYNIHDNEQGAPANRLTSKAAAQIALTWVINALGTENRGIKERPDLIVLNKTTVPAILIETCFISNPEDAVKIKDPQTLDKLAENIYKSITIMLNDYNFR